MRAKLVVALLLTASTASAQTPCNGSVGPDVIVGDITGPVNILADGTYDALGLGTVSCNVGDTWLNWFAHTNQHPVIAQSLYKYKLGPDGVARFEQLGMSFLKHGFFARSETLCCAECTTTNGTHLGVGCSDPYAPARNADQTLLYPRWQVNAFTGDFTYPPADPPYAGRTARRLRAKLSDLEDSSLTVRFFAEAHYVSPDDAAADNHHNNASYRELTVFPGFPNDFSLIFGFDSETQREKSAIEAWQAIDPQVRLVRFRAGGEGTYILASQVVALPGGSWNYEYALYNMNSDRCVQALAIPAPQGETISDIGFHDVEYHPSDGVGGVTYSGDDWPATIANGAITWATQSYAENQNANALRWGTTYNFRFVSSAPPRDDGQIVLTLFKPGSPANHTLTGVQTPARDCDDDGVPDDGDRTPTIVMHPQSHAACAGGATVFSVAASGAGLAYRWRKNDADLDDGGTVSGAHTPMLTIQPVGTADTGAYTVRVSNGCGSVLSDAATLAVEPLPGDVNSDGACDLTDLAILLSNFGTPAGMARRHGDLDGDGDVDLSDLAVLLARFGTACP